jgi:hypothetical protein
MRFKGNHCATPRLRRALIGAAAVLGSVASQHSLALDFSYSGFATLALGRSSGACTEGALSDRYNLGCTRFIADWAHAGVYRDTWSAKQESRAGLQGTLRLSPELSATAQVTARALEDQHLNLEWAYLSYKFSPSLTLQLGRKRLPLYYYSDFQDIGYAYNTVRPSPDVYGWDVVNYNGASLSHSSNFGELSVRSELLLGSENSRDNAYSKMVVNDPKDVRWSGIGGAAVEVSYDWFSGRLSYVRSKFRQIDRATGAVEVDPSGPRQSFLGLALNGDVGNWVIRTEFGSSDRDLIGYKAKFYLATVGYRLGDFTLTGGSSAYRETAAAGSGYNPVKLRSELLALRYELHKGGALKLQFDRVRDQGAPAYVGNSRLLSATYDVVF